MRNKDFKSTVWFKIFIGSAVLLVFALFIFASRSILMPFFLAFLVAYVLDPVVDWLEKWKIRRTVGIAAIIGVMVILFMLLCSILYPVIHKQISDLSSNIPVYAEKFKTRLGPVIRDFSLKHEQEINDSIDNAKNYIRNNAFSILSPITKFITRTFSSALNLLLGLLNVIIIPVFAFYLLKDIDILLEKLGNLIPLKYREWTIGKFKEVDEAMGHFIRGQITVAAILALIYSVFLWAVGVPMGVLIGIIAGFANIVPYLGIAVGIVPACLLAYLEFGISWQILAVLAIFAGAQMLEGMVITPKVVGDKVGLHPLTVVVAIIIGGEMFGFLGILLAVPGAAALMVFLKAGYQYYMSSEFYLGKKPSQKKHYRRRPKRKKTTAPLPEKQD